MSGPEFLLTVFVVVALGGIVAGVIERAVIDHHERYRR